MAPSLCRREITKRRNGTNQPPYDGLGLDHVTCIHCSFWPSVASEWVDRTRASGWPSEDAINKIVDFGFHLVPIGYPHSPMKMMEWRISFSVAERLLVWSFSHTQLQMYAILKLILKEFIKPKCSTENYVLCSYFIKTFLFWKFEETERSFWKIEKFRDCLKFLMNEFCMILRDGTLKHYFIPIFNLFEVKLTREAQLELFHLYHIAIHYDMKIIGQCRTLNPIWEKFSEGHSDPEMSLTCTGQRKCLRCYMTKQNFINTTKSIIDSTRLGFNRPCTSGKILNALVEISLQSSTSLLSLTVGICCLHHNLHRNSYWPKANKSIYSMIQFLNNSCMDIATGKLWTAILHLLKYDYNRALLIINNLLSSIPPYALYRSRCGLVSGSDAHNLYTETYVNSELTFPQIAKRAWLFDFCVHNHFITLVPAAIQIELMFGDPAILSPFTCAYYLQFLCYHGLRQFDNRDNSLRQLTEVPEKPEQCGSNCMRYSSFNIAGHCLLVAGDKVRAREMFLKSCEVHSRYGSKCNPQANSAVYYLHNYLS